MPASHAAANHTSLPDSIAARHDTRPVLDFPVGWKVIKRAFRASHDLGELRLAEAQLLLHVFSVCPLELRVVSRLRQFVQSGRTGNLA